VKFTTSRDGSGLMLLGDSDETRSTLEAERASSSILLRDGETSSVCCVLDARRVTGIRPVRGSARGERSSHRPLGRSVTSIFVPSE
jgi:hypothetical protein